MCKIVILLAATLALISGQVLAQNAPPVILPCNTASSLNWNNTALFGTWFEVARNPLNNTNACMEITVGLLHDNTTLNINVTHSNGPNSLYASEQESANVTLVTNANTGYSVQFVGGNTPTTFIKLLQFVNQTYLVGCGYYNAQDMTTSYGFILAHGNYNASGIQIANNEAATQYANFKTDTYGNITQTGCSKSNSATLTLPLISGLVAVAYLLLKL